MLTSKPWNQGIFRPLVQAMMGKYGQAIQLYKTLEKFKPREQILSSINKRGKTTGFSEVRLVVSASGKEEQSTFLRGWSWERTGKGHSIEYSSYLSTQWSCWLAKKNKLRWKVLALREGDGSEELHVTQQSRRVDRQHAEDGATVLLPYLPGLIVSGKLGNHSVVICKVLHQDRRNLSKVSRAPGP